MLNTNDKFGTTHQSILSFVMFYSVLSIWFLKINTPLLVIFCLLLLLLFVMSRSKKQISKF